MPARRRRIETAWYLLTALVAAVSLAVQLVLIVRGVNVLVPAGGLPAVSTRVIRFFSYFTVQSNILVIVTAVALAVRPDRDGPVWRVLRLDALVGITLTFFTYVVLLAPIVKVSGIAKWTDIGFHYVTPIMTVLGWLVIGPRPRIDERTLMLALIWPALYVGYTLAHGASTSWYPYPFVDAHALGYSTTLRNGAGLMVVLVGLGALFMFVDHRLAGPDRRAGGPY